MLVVPTPHSSDLDLHRQTIKHRRGRSLVSLLRNAKGNRKRKRKYAVYGRFSAL